MKTSISKTEKPKLAYILSQFPRYDETFILREITELRRNGLGIFIFSLKKCRDKVIHEEAKKLIPFTFYIPFLLSLELWAAQFYFIFRMPEKYFGMLLCLVKNMNKRPSVLLKSLAIFPKSVYFAKILKERGIRHIHAHWATHPTTAAMIISRLTGVPFSFTGHAHDIYLDTTMLSEKLRNAEFVLTCTKYNKKYLSSFCTNGADAKIYVSYHGVHLDRFQIQNDGRSNGKFEILSVGSLLECKGFPYLIKACQVLKEKGLKFRCTIVGGGPEEEKLRDQIVRCGLEECVSLPGYVTQENIVNYYQQAHVFVLPAVLAIHWGIPNVVLEAAATKVPVICTPLASIPEVIQHAQSGIIVPEKDPQALAHWIQRLYLDGDLRRQLAGAAHERVCEDFDLTKNARKLAGIFCTHICEDKSLYS